MKNHLRRALTVLALLISSCSQIDKREIAADSCVSENHSFFVAVPITRYSDIQVPCIPIEIEQRTYAVELDLGSNGALTLTDEALANIRDKVAVGEGVKYGITGTSYPYTAYNIPALNIGSCSFSSARVRSGSIDMKNDSILMEGTGEVAASADGAIGWPAFVKTNLLIDTNRDIIAFCSDWKALEEHGYKRGDFYQTSFSAESGLLVFSAQIDGKERSCVLDTGTTLSALHKSSSQRTSDLKASLTPYPVAFCEGNTEEILFMHIPFNLPIKIDAILGMNFVHEHVIFIDFSSETIYFSRKRK